MADTATISGGNQVSPSLSQVQFHVAQSALTALSQNYQAGQVLTSSTGSSVSSGSGSHIGSATSSATISFATGNDTITLGTGNDTVNAMGSATMTGGSGSLYFAAGNATTSGNETMFGGSGPSSFYSSHVSGSEGVTSATGAKLFEQSDSGDTLSATSSAHSDTFDFASSVSGGQHSVDGFTFNAETQSNAKTQLVGYSQTDVGTPSHSSVGSIVTLNDGTTITMRGVSSSASQDVTFKPDTMTGGHG